MACEVEESQIFLRHHAAEVIAAETSRVKRSRGRKAKASKIYPNKEKKRLVLNESLFRVKIPALKANLFNNLPLVTKRKKVTRWMVFRFKDIDLNYYSSYTGMLWSER